MRDRAEKGVNGVAGARGPARHPKKKDVSTGQERHLGRRPVQEGVSAGRRGGNEGPRNRSRLIPAAGGGAQGGTPRRRRAQWKPGQAPE